MGVCGLCVLVILPKMYIFPHFHKQKLAFIYGVRYIVSTQWHFANSIFFLFPFYCCRSFFYGFVFFSLFDRFLYAQLFIHRVHIPYAFMAFVHILIRRWRKKKHIVTSMGSNTRSSDDYIMCWWVLEEDWQKASTILYTKIHFKWNK